MNDTRYYVPEEDRDRLSAVYRRSEDGSLTQLPKAESLAFNTNDSPPAWTTT